MFSDQELSLSFSVTWVVFVSENDLDFAGLNHAMCDWLNICETANQNTEKIRFHENGMSGMSVSLPSQTNPLTRSLPFQRQNNRLPRQYPRHGRQHEMLEQIIPINWWIIEVLSLIPLEPSFLMDYRPFIYGGLASMTAEFGEIICFIPLTVTKPEQKQRKAWNSI